MTVVFDFRATPMKWTPSNGTLRCKPTLCIMQCRFLTVFHSSLDICTKHCLSYYFNLFSGQILSFLQRRYDLESRLLNIVNTKISCREQTLLMIDEWMCVVHSENSSSSLYSKNLQVWTMDKDGCVHDLQVNQDPSKKFFGLKALVSVILICCSGSSKGDLHY